MAVFLYNGHSLNSSKSFQTLVVLVRCTPLTEGLIARSNSETKKINRAIDTCKIFRPNSAQHQTRWGNLTHMAGDPTKEQQLAC